MTPASDAAIVALSLKVAIAGTVIALPFAIAIALVLARGRFWGHTIPDALVYMPLGERQHISAASALLTPGVPSPSAPSRGLPQTKSARSGDARP